MRWAGYVACMRKVRKANKILVEKPEGKRSLERPRHGWEDNIRMNLRDIGWERVDWIHLAQDKVHWRALVNTVIVMFLGVP
jgi:hypothetical protein